MTKTAHKSLVNVTNVKWLQEFFLEIYCKKIKNVV